MRLVLAVTIALVGAAPLSAQLCTGNPLDGYSGRLTFDSSASPEWRSVGLGAGWSPTSRFGLDVHATEDATIEGHWSGSTLRISGTGELPVPAVSLCLGVGVTRVRSSGLAPHPGFFCLWGGFGAGCPPITVQSSEGWRIPFTVSVGQDTEVTPKVRIGAAGSLAGEFRQWERSLAPGEEYAAVSDLYGAVNTGASFFLSAGRLVLRGTLEGFWGSAANVHEVSVTVRF